MDGAYLALAGRLKSLQRMLMIGGGLALSLGVGVAGAQEADLPAGPGRDVLTRSCGACHQLELITSKRDNRTGWEATVGTMMANGAQVSDAEKVTLVNYLAQNFSNAPRPAVAAQAAPAPPAAAPAAGATPAAPGAAPAPAAAAAAAAAAPRSVYGNRPAGMGTGASPFLANMPAAKSPLDSVRPVTDAMLINPPAENWLTWRRTYDDHGFSPLAQINKGNVNTLKLAWSWSLPPGPQEGTPLVHDGVMLVPGYGDVVLAFDAATGDVLWQYLPTTGGRVNYKKNLAVYGDKVYAAASDGNVVALNIKTGEVVWKSLVGANVGMSGGPLIAKGKVIIGTAGGRPGGGEIVGMDAQTGAIAWRFHTVAQPGTPGGESWNGQTAEQRTGGTVWTAGSYEPSVNLVYFGTGSTYNTGPLRKRIDQAGVTTDALYTDATVALDPETGKLVWFYQHMKNDQWDMDWAFERIVFDVTVNGRVRKVVTTAGKPGVYDVLDAKTGEYLFSKDMGIQNLITAVDPKTGEKTTNPLLDPSLPNFFLCPYFNSGKEWLPGSYSDRNKLIYAPLNEACAAMFQLPPGQRGLLTGLGYTMQPPKDHDGNYSHLAAWNPQTNKIEWVLRQREPLTTGTLATQGGVVFTGFTDRRLKAFDDATGKELWSTRLNDTPSGAPISYSVNGKQYVAIIAGCCSIQTRDVQAYVPEVKLPPDHGAVVWVFELPDPPRR